ncbi:MAG: hypothetical protein ABJA98_00320 [Acidobacteriota bacterium]
MNRRRHFFAATIVGAMCGGGLTFAQAPADPAPKAPEMKSVLAGKKFTPPIRGEATIDIIKSPTRREGTTLVTKIQVKNTSPGPIPRLTVDETWYDKKNNLIPGGKGVINGLLQPGEIQTMEVRTPVNPNMATSMLQFSHANGTVKTHATSSFVVPDPAAKAPAKKK